MSLASVKRYLAEHAPDLDVIELAASTATVALAAEAHGVEPGRIAKTLSLWVGDEVVLLVTRGDVRLDNQKYKARFRTKPRMLGATEVEVHTGHPVGGVCPFGLPRAMQVLRRVVAGLRRSAARGRRHQRRGSNHARAAGHADRRRVGGRHARRGHARMIDPGSQLCTRCGLCCDGTLLGDVELTGPAEVTRLATLGIDVDPDDEAPVLPLPCTALCDRRCGIYPHRPRSCRDFACRLLEAVRREEVTMATAVRRVARARQAARVRALWATPRGTTRTCRSANGWRMPSRPGCRRPRRRRSSAP
ncbi:MAG: YbaK/EbsC family protein [Vicinamibacterales bacterium]